MGASQFVGRVGGLAVALGLGVSLFSGVTAVAWADAGSQSDSETTSAGKANTGRAASSGTARGTARHSRAATPAPSAATPAVAEAVDAAPAIDLDPEVDPVPTVVTDPVADPVPLADEGPVVAPDVIAYSAPPTPAPTAKAGASARLTAAPKTIYYDGVLQGNLNVTSARGCGLIGNSCTLDYAFVDSSAGGKATLGKVPTALPGLPTDAAGGAGSYTFLPYATWIDQDLPTRFPVASGTQDFTVRVTENTKFDQFVTSIPLVGMIAKPVISLMQQLPLISGLLAPLIGASILTTVNVNVGDLVASGKQVAYTYTVSSFDDTPISMNYFPAAAPSLILPGQQQATIFNGPGLGSPGETNPYGSFQAAGSVPGLSIMRGQGLPDPLGAAPLGFNVITWDPRGEFASGGTLQLDSPFFEGRDVSSLITWANANTPLLNEKNSPDAEPTPDIAMMGGSYGGGIQMTTVDPRIETIVPSIAWNSLNESLYPDNVFKSGWANTLALALLEAGANVNPLINQGIIRGNLTGNLSVEQQATLASSGPTVLLSKLSIPTMYDQGIVDALFPLQQALDNARTQLEDNPFFAGNEDLVKMIWFCGGHGVCTTQTTAQQTEQNTLMFLENLLWVNKYSKNYLPAIPLPPNPYGAKNLGQLVDLAISLVAPFQWWDQNGRALASGAGMPWTGDFQDIPPIFAENIEGGRINSFTSRSGPLTSDDPAGAVCASVSSACGFPLKNVFATEATNAVEVAISVPATTDPNAPSVIVGAPLVSFTYSGIGGAKAVYAQVVDNATGQVLGNINTAIPVTLDGKEHTVDAFPIANIAYTAPGLGGKGLTLQIVGRSTNFKAAFSSVDISDVSVSLPTTTTAQDNPLAALF